jgi:HK97 gp10 family phage protein
MPAEAVTLVGKRDLLAKFKSLAEFVDEGPIEDAAFAAGKVVRSAALSNIRAQVRRKTGNLEKSIKVEKPRRKLKGFPGAFIMADFNIAPHRHLIEFGTVKAPAYPYFRPALDHNRARALSIIARATKRELNRVARAKRRGILMRKF